MGRTFKLGVKPDGNLGITDVQENQPLPQSPHVSEFNAVAIGQVAPPNTEAKNDLVYKQTVDLQLNTI